MQRLQRAMCLCQRFVTLPVSRQWPLAPVWPTVAPSWATSWPSQAPEVASKGLRSFSTRPAQPKSMTRGAEEHLGEALLQAATQNGWCPSLAGSFSAQIPRSTFNPRSKWLEGAGNRKGVCTKAEKRPFQVKTPCAGLDHVPAEAQLGPKKGGVSKISKDSGANRVKTMQKGRVRPLGGLCSPLQWTCGEGWPD